MKAKQLPLSCLKSGMKIKFTITGSEFELVTVTEKRVSWYVPFSYKGGSGKNIMKMSTVTRQQFERGLASGGYVLLAKDVINKL